MSREWQIPPTVELAICEAIRKSAWFRGGIERGQRGETTYVLFAEYYDGQAPNILITRHFDQYVRTVTRIEALRKDGAVEAEAAALSNLRSVTRRRSLRPTQAEVRQRKNEFARAKRREQLRRDLEAAGLSSTRTGEGAWHHAA